MKARTTGASGELAIDSGRTDPRTLFLARGGEVVALPNAAGPDAYYSLRFAEEAKGAALVTTITVAINRRVRGEGLFRRYCFASAQAVVADGGPISSTG